VIGFWYGFMHPVFGLQMMASSTMYGNVRNFGIGNHYLVPTGLLQNWLASPQAVAAAPSWLGDYAGGYVRVERTTSPSLRQLAVRGAEVTEKLPPRSRELLESVNASGRYFEFYAARNYFDRQGDLKACALNDIEKNESSTLNGVVDEKYVVPVFELRRAVEKARNRGEAFKLEYTKLPAELHMPSEWRAYKGSLVVLEEPGGGKASSCVEVQPDGKATSECQESEVVRLPPPGWWVSKWLIPYPFPLVEGAGDEVHCST